MRTTKTTCLLLGLAACVQAQTPAEEAMALQGRYEKVFQEAAKAKVDPGASQASREKLGMEITRISALLLKERRPEIRQVLLMAQSLMLRIVFKPSGPDGPPEARWRESTFNEIQTMNLAAELPPSSPALALAEPVDPDLLRELAWFSSGGGSADQSPDDAGRLAKAYLAEAMEHNPSPAVRKSALGHLAWFLTTEGIYSGDFKEAEALIARMEPGSKAAAELRAQIKEARERVILRVGQMVPGFSVQDLDAPGREITPGTFKGRYVLLDFWATWCGPCKKELPILAQAHERFKGKGLAILSLSMDRKAAEVVAWRKDAAHPMPWRNAFVEGGFASPVGKAFGIQGIPMPVLVGPDGRIVATDMDLRGAQLLKTLARVLGE